MSPHSSYPTKRPPRPRRDKEEKAAHEDVLRALLAFPVLHQWAEQFDHRPTVVGGRPSGHPAVVKLLFGIMAWEWGGLRGAHREIRTATNWGIISKALRPMYPEWACFKKGGQPVTRFQYAHFRDQHCLDDKTLETLLMIALVDAASQAQGMGQLVRDCGGSVTHPSPARIASGDGTVLPPRYRGVPGDLQLNDATGELEQVRHDPDCDWYTTGDKRRVRGHSFVLLETRNEHEDEAVLLSVRLQPKGHPGGEGAIAMDMIKQVRPLLPGLQGITWDKALRGKHIDELYDLGLQAIVKVAKAKGGKPKSRRIGPHTVHGAAANTIDVFAKAGSIGIEVPVAGKMEWVRCEQTKRTHHRDLASSRWYATYRIPDEAPVPAGLRNGVFRVRLNGRTESDPPQLNRAEVIRPVTEADPEWQALYARRPGSESTNSWFKARLPKGRAPALGAKRNRFEMICLQIFANVRALIAFVRRTGAPPPTS